MRNPFFSLIEGQVAGMQQQVAGAMEELAATEIEGSAGGGAVKIIMTGSGTLVRVEIEPEVLQEDCELVQDLVAAAMQDVIGKVSTLKREKILAATPLGALGVDIPDIF
jgi:DNA-binding YbaB/EbfC family protein